MFNENDNNDTHTDSSNYPVVEDTKYTLDEIESIKKFKAERLKKDSKNESVLKALETAGWGITSYSLARFLILTVGLNGVTLAVALTFFINNIANRDLLDNINLNFNEGFHFTGMDKMVRFLGSVIISGFVCWSAIGDLYNFERESKQTYNNIQNSIEQFNRLPKDDRNQLIIGCVLGAGAATVVIMRAIRK